MSTSATVPIIEVRAIGDFYEAFGDHAKRLSEACGLTLTRRRSDGVALCGFPIHRMFGPNCYFNRAEASGYTLEVVESDR